MAWSVFSSGDRIINWKGGPPVDTVATCRPSPGRTEAETGIRSKMSGSRLRTRRGDGKGLAPAPLGEAFLVDSGVVAAKYVSRKDLEICASSTLARAGARFFSRLDRTS